MQELERIRAAYEKRKKQVPKDYYSYFNPACLFTVQQREREILRALKKQDIASLNEKLILDLGCGIGNELRRLVLYGAELRNLYGLDLLSDKIEEAKRISPNINFICSNAEKLPYESGFFDIILCFTVFTSILEKGMRKNIAAQMLRVLKQPGIIIWYDFFLGNPWNPDVRGVGKAEIFELFPGTEIRLKRITLATPLARLVAPWSTPLCYLLEKAGIFNAHYLGIIKKK